MRTRVLACSCALVACVLVCGARCSRLGACSVALRAGRGVWLRGMGSADVHQAWGLAFNLRGGFTVSVYDASKSDTCIHAGESACSTACLIVAPL